LDGGMHAVDSKPIAFELCAKDGFREAAPKCKPQIMEPIMKLEVITPEEYVGPVIGDLNRRRGVIQGMDDLPGGTKQIRVEVPLSEMFGYATSMRSMSQGRATYSMEFVKYAETPRNVADAIIAKFASGGKKGADDEE